MWCLPGWRAESCFWWECWCLQIVDSGRLVVSTKCGHVFCSQCLRDALTSSHTCPTCRKRLTHRQYHPLYIWRHHADVCPALFFLTIYKLTVLNDCQVMHIIDYSSYSLFFEFSNCVNKFWLSLNRNFGLYVITTKTGRCCVWFQNLQETMLKRFLTRYKWLMLSLKVLPFFQQSSNYHQSDILVSIKISILCATMGKFTNGRSKSSREKEEV